MLLLREINRTVHVTKTVNDEIQCLLVVAHPAQQEDHFKYEVALVADIICLWAYRTENRKDTEHEELQHSPPQDYSSCSREGSR